MSVLGAEAVDDVASEAMSFADQAYLVIRDRLIMLDIRPNEAIVESELATQLKLGRTPVREALKRLEADRLVVSFPRRGTFATGVDVADLRHISQIRVNLEPVAARSAAENASAAVRANLLELAERTDALDVDHIDRDELMRWDLRVHRAVYQASGKSSPRGRPGAVRQPRDPDLLPVPRPAAHGRPPCRRTHRPAADHRRR